MHQSMRRTGGRRSDQGRVWRNIAEKAANMGAESATSAMSAIYEKHARGLDELVRQFQALEGQSGAVFAIGNSICGLDAFDKPATFATLLPKLVRSYGIDAMELGLNHETAPGIGEVGDFLKNLAAGKIEEHPAAGLGDDIRIEARDVIAGGLVTESSLLHLAAFNEPRRRNENAGDRSSFADYRQRRSGYRRRQ